MKSIVKYLLFASIMLPIGFTIQSCERDNEHISDHKLPEDIKSDSDDPNPGEASGNYVLLSVTEKNIYPSGMVLTNKNFSNPFYKVESYTGRTVLESYDMFDGSRHYEYTYSVRENSIVCSHGTGLYDTYEYTLNSDKRIVKAECDEELYSYSYDSRNRLISINSSYAGSNHQIEELSYDDKYNVIGYTRKGENGETLRKAIIEYTTYPTKSMPWNYYDVLSDIRIDSYLLEQGFFGNTIPIYLVKRIAFNSSGSESERVYEYTLDKNGYVIEMREIDFRTDMKFITTWNFEWKEVSIPSYSNWLFSDVASPYYRYLQ